MDLLQEYKELYYKELEFKGTLNSKMDASITFLTILCTGHMFMWNIMCDLSLVIRPFPILFLLVEVLSVMFTAQSFYFFYKSYFHYKYEYISPENLNKELMGNLSLDKYYTQTEICEANNKLLQNTYIKYAITIRNENLRKSSNQMNFSNSIIKGIALLIISYSIWVFIISRTIY